MKIKMLGALAVSSMLVACNQGGSSAKEVALDSEMQKVSYSFGVDLGSRIGQNMELDVDAFSAGVRDAIEENEWRMTQEEIVATLQAYQQKQMAEQQAKQSAAAEANKKASEDFLAENAKKEGVVTLPSGLQYQVIEAGEGAKPGADDEVTVHYAGTLIDGTEFDSSYKRGEPITLPVGGVIAGWTEALQLMPVGSKWKLFIPSDLAYGPGGTGGAIGPNAALIFDVELIGIGGEEAAAED